MRYRRCWQSPPCRNLVQLGGQLPSTRRPSQLPSRFPSSESDLLSSQMLTHSCVRTFVRLQTRRVCNAEERCNPLICPEVICPEVFSGAFVFHCLAQPCWLEHCYLLSMRQLNRLEIRSGRAQLLNRQARPSTREPPLLCAS